MTSEGRELVVGEELRVAAEEVLAAEQLIGIALYRIAMTRGARHRALEPIPALAPESSFVGKLEE